MVRRIIVFLLVFAWSSAQIQGKFLLLMGPSGAGKSTIINHLKAIDGRFTYVTPFTTRELRPGEQDKKHISLDELNVLHDSGKLLAINHIYGIYYATPKYIIDEALAQQRFPVLDWPIDKMNIMEQYYDKQIYRVYVEPDDIQELERRLSNDARDKDGKRFQAGKLEIDNLLSGKYDTMIDYRVVNKAGHALQVAEEIYQHFLQSLEKEQ